MIGFPNCKINLGLRVKYKRDDGFHEIETVMYPLQLKETLEIVPSDKDQVGFTSSGLAIPENGKMNLCEQAYALMLKKYKMPNVNIHLHKKIPVGAGLGGGSADAAFTFLILKRLFNLPVNNEEMHHFSSKLGSDISFFLKNQPAVARGKGDQLSSCDVILSGKHLVLVVDPIHISTAEAYSGIKITNRKVPGPEEVISQPIETWRALMVNDFEPHIFAKYPVLKNIKEKLYTLGASYASMTGSGSAVYGIFSTPPNINTKKHFPNSFIWQERLSI